MWISSEIDILKILETFHIVSLLWIQTFRVVAGFKHMQLVRIMGKCEDFDHGVEDHHNSERQNTY